MYWGRRLLQSSWKRFSAEFPPPSPPEEGAGQNSLSWICLMTSNLRSKVTHMNKDLWSEHLLLSQFFDISSGCRDVGFQSSTWFGRFIFEECTWIWLLWAVGTVQQKFPQIMPSQVVILCSSSTQQRNEKHFWGSCGGSILCMNYSCM